MSDWICPTFEETPKKIEKFKAEKREPAACHSEVTDVCMWSEKYGPQKKADLAVHPKKVQEVQSWLESALNGALGIAPIAIFSGPSGSGKTATLKVLSKSMGFTLKEWINPSKVPPPVKGDHRGRERDYFEQSSMLKLFEEFLFRASRYTSVLTVSNPTTCVLLVEDVPNVYIRDTSAFEKTLHKFSEFGRSPVVFICTNGSAGLNLERLLFKVKFQRELNIKNISFNPVGRKLLIHSLNRVVILGKLKDPNSFNHIEESSIVRAADISNSDIRFAINQLQFQFCGVKGYLKELPLKHSNITMRRGKGRKKLEKDSDFLGGKDQFNDVFRCLGRVLYCKKEELFNLRTKEVKQKLVHDPDKIVNLMFSTPNLFLGLLNENYVDIFTDIKKIAESGMFLSQSDIIMSNWRERDIEINYSLTISVLGLMNASSVSIQRKWHPFRGSKAKESVLSYYEKVKTCRRLFPERIHDTRAFLTEVLPFYAKIDTSKLHEDQKKFMMSVIELTSLRKKSSSSLDEEDTIAKSNVGSQETLPSISKFTIKQELSAVPLMEDIGEEVDIEEYDSDEFVLTGR